MLNMKEVRELILKNRSYRRYDESHIVDMDSLQSLIVLARLSPSSANLQFLKFAISNTPEKNYRVFTYLKWAGYFKDWAGPEPGERPSSYIIILADKKITKNTWCDHGIAAQSILLGASAMGLGGCIFGNVDRDGLRAEFSIPDRYRIMLVLAIGKPKERVVIEKVGPDRNIKYWRDPEGVHHVPKRPLEELILNL